MYGEYLLLSSKSAWALATKHLLVCSQSFGSVGLYDRQRLAEYRACQVLNEKFEDAEPSASQNQQQSISLMNFAKEVVGLVKYSTQSEIAAALFHCTCAQILNGISSHHPEIGEQIYQLQIDEDLVSRTPIENSGYGFSHEDMDSLDRFSSEDWENYILRRESFEFTVSESSSESRQNSTEFKNNLRVNFYENLQDQESASLNELMTSLSSQGYDKAKLGEDEDIQYVKVGSASHLNKTFMKNILKPVSESTNFKETDIIMLFEMIEA